MSTNITGEIVIKCDAWMYAKDVQSVCELHRAEVNFIDEILDDASRAGPNEMVHLPEDSFWWHGEGSVRSFDRTLINEIVPKIHGVVEVVFVWEGQTLEGLRIVDGEVTVHEVNLSLGALKQ